MYDPEKHNPQKFDLQEQAVSAEVAATCLHDNCKCDMRYPTDWEQAEGTLWKITLRCPSCEDFSTVVMGEYQIERFDHLLGEGADVIVRNLRNLTYSNMAEEAKVFIGALAADHILPEDF